MKQGIVICSWSGGQLWLTQALRSLEDCKYPVTVTINDCYNANADWISQINREVVLIPEDSYEVGSINVGREIYDEFFFIQDTCEFKDLAILDKIFKELEGTSIQWGHRFQCYLGKFRKVILDQLDFPVVRTKTDSVANETDFIKMYKDKEPNIIELFPQFNDFAGIEERHFGRNNLKIQNEYMIKWKGYWVG